VNLTAIPSNGVFEVSVTDALTSIKLVDNPAIRELELE